jgi:very-short-patch-repair endonuclease
MRARPGERGAGARRQRGTAAGLSVGGPILGGMGNEMPARLQALAYNQAGVVSRRQALGSGLTRGAIDGKVRSGWWRPVHTGVYATFTGPFTRAALLWAAVLYAGPDAYLSHATAAEVNRLTEDLAPSIDVSVPSHRRVTPANGLVIHLASHKAMLWRPPKVPPYTIAEQTVVDLVQAAASKDEVIALVTGGFSRRLLAQNHLRAVAETRGRLRWRKELDEIAAMAAGGTHSVLEYHHDHDVQRAHGLPEPVKQARFRKPDGTNGYRDRYYPQYGGLVIELDGKRFHPAERRGRDQERDNQAAVAGATLRYGWAEVTSRACETARQEGDALRYRGWGGTLSPCAPDCRAAAGNLAPGQVNGTATGDRAWR